MAQLDISNYKNIHLIGIGGVGVGAIAKVLIEMGFKVSGSDLKESVNTIRLKEMGAHIFFGHSPSNVREADLVVFSSAIAKDNPEILEAKSRQIKCIPRAEMLSWILSQSKIPIAVAGTHGKTTTTSMLSLVFEKSGLNPTFLIGGETTDVGGNAKLGNGKYSIAEADESDGSFLLLNPKIIVLTNIEADHLDYFGDIQKVREAFLKFANSTPSAGKLVICADDPENNFVMENLESSADLITYGLSENAIFRARNITNGEGSIKFEVLRKGKLLGEIKLNIPGVHNVLNSLAAIAVGMNEGIDFVSINTALRCFTGVRRRFQLIGKAGGILIYDDYGHHPTEIAATLKAAKESISSAKRVICVFQPHRFSRTFHLKELFGKCFKDCDQLILTEVYSAGEAPISGVSGETILEEVLKNRQEGVLYLPKKQDITNYLFENAVSGDLIITMGAGDINTIGKELYSRLREKHKNERII